MKLTDLKGIGEKTAMLLNKLSVYTAEDLAALYPRSYDIYEKPVLVSGLSKHTKTSAAIDAVIAKTPALKRVRSLQILTTTLKDEKGDTIKATWFNMPYLLNSLRLGYRYVFRGRPVFKNGEWVMEQPAIYTLDQYSKMMGVMQPIYPLTKGLSNKIVSKAVMQTLEIKDLKTDYLPENIRSGYKLLTTQEALKSIHFPQNADECSLARKRIVFDEFFLFTLNMKRMKEHNEEQPNMVPIDNFTQTDDFIRQLPYELTGAQKRTWDDVKSDLTKDRLMNRLIQGDVGSGKTIIAVLAMMNTVYSGYQSAMMVPTEVLAVQQFEDINALFNKYGIDIRTSLLIGSMTALQKKCERERIASGEAQIVIGTHALIQEKVEYSKLALVITDEQHRFGVCQRENLAKKGMGPHILVMSATPIPRTLAIILYGDLDISLMNELPSSRLPVKNAVVDINYRPNAYRFIERQVREGRQAYVICPMVQKSDDGDIIEDERVDLFLETNMSSSLENVVDYAQKLQKELPGVRIEYLHGKMKPSVKNEIMERFNANVTQVLVSTTVIEVGVNVPNATVMLIENADRFGLAQLHQLRGRVGRGSFQSYCIFVESPNSKKANVERLNIMRDSNDGFKIAEEDLKLRGPGDFFGIRQSGDMRFELADIYKDADILKQAFAAAEGIMKDDPELEKEEHKALKAYIDKQNSMRELVL